MDALSCLGPPAALLASSFADTALARALHFSMSSDSAASSYLSAPAQQNQQQHPSLSLLAYASAPHVTCDSVLVADSPPRRSPAGGRKQHLAPASAGRVGKRRSRASKRAPTTYISTDPANFRIMVQQITGVQAEPADAGILHPTTTFDAAVLLAVDGAHAGAFDGSPLLTAVAPGDEASTLHQQLQQPCFPTLDSWNVMYESNELL